MYANHINPIHVLRSLLPKAPLYLHSFWLVILIFSLLFGIFISRVFSPYQRSDITPEWHNAQLITSYNNSPVTYFRRSFSLDYLPGKAYLQIAAPDNYKVYVNGHYIDELKRVSTSVYGLFDVANYLQAGQNLIAIRVERKTIPGTAYLLANLQWLDPTDVQHSLITDDLWRASVDTVPQHNGALKWYQNNYDDISWSYSKESDAQILPVEAVYPWATPELFTLFPRGNWISDGFSETTGTSYTREFDLINTGRGDIKFAWLGIASASPYTIIINGVRIPMMDSTVQHMTTYNIGNFLFAGKNTIAIDSSNVNASGRIAVSAIIKTDTQFIDLSSDDNWQVRNFGGQWKTVTIMGKLNSFPYLDKESGRFFHTPIIQFKTIKLPGGLLLRHTAATLPWISLSFIISMCIIVYGFSRGSFLNINIIKSGLLPWLLADLLFFTALLLPLDIRITEADIFNLYVLSAISVLTLTLFTLIMIKTERDHGNF